MKIPFHILLILLLASCTQYKPDLQHAERLMERAPDSALHILQRIPASKISGEADHALYALLMSQALDKNDIKVQSDSLTSIATDYYNDDDPEHAGYAWFYHARSANNRGDAQEQADNLLKAQEYAVQTKNYKLQGLVYGDKGLMYRSQRQFDSSICYYKKAYYSFSKIKDSYNSILGLLSAGGDFVRCAKLDSGLYYFHLAEKKTNNSCEKELLSSMYRNIGSAYFMQNDYNKALYYYNKAPLTGTPIYDGNKWLLIANVYLRLQEADSARYYLRKVKVVKELAPSYYEFWMKLNEKDGNYKTALENSKNVTIANDSLKDWNLKVSFAGLEKKYKYQGLQISNQRLEIKNKQKNVYLLFGLLVLIAFGFAVALWRLKVRRNQFLAQANLLSVEKSLVQTEKQKVEKERENNTLLERQLKMQSIILLNIEQHRKNAILRPSTPKLVTKEAKQQQNEVFYQELIASMDLEYNNISQRLLDAHPSLMPRDVLICCLLLAGFETGMIATILDVKIDSMNVHRSRLRKKLNLPTSVDLVSFLLHF